MIKIIRYTFFDLIRSSWTYFYLGFYLLLSSILLFLNNDISKSVITLMNVIIVLIPLISTIFGVMYYYNAREFIELLLAQPIPRKNIFLGQYLGISLSLSLSFIIGLGVPFLFYGLFLSSEIFNFIMLIITGVFLSFIFVGFSYLIGLYNENKIKGFSFAIFIWLFMAVIFDGLFLICFMVFRQYPLDTFSMPPKAGYLGFDGLHRCHLQVFLWLNCRNSRLLGLTLLVGVRNYIYDSQKNT